MKTYTNPQHPEQGFDPRSKGQIKADNERSEETEKEKDRLESDDDNLDDGSGTTENPAIEDSMN